MGLIWVRVMGVFCILVVGIHTKLLPIPEKLMLNFYYHVRTGSGLLLDCLTLLLPSTGLFDPATIIYWIV